MVKNSLKTKLILSIVFLIFVFGALAAYAVFLYSKETFIDNEVQVLELLTIEQAQETGRVFEYSQKLVETIAHHIGVNEHFYGETLLQDTDILHELESYNIADMYSAIYIMDKDGNTLISTNQSFVGKNYSFRDYFQQAITGRPWVDIAVGVTSGQLGYYFSHPIQTIDGAIQGAVVAKMQPEFIHESVGLSEKLSGGHIMLVNHNGIIIYSDDKERIYSSLGILDEEVRDDIATKKRFSGLEIKPLDYDVVQSDLDAIVQSKVFNIFDTRDNEQEIVAVSRINKLPFFIIIEEEEEKYVEQALGIAWSLSIFILLAALLATLLIYWLVRRFLKPLSQLKETVEEISAGNLDKDINIDTKDEIGDLSHSFGSMLKSLKSSKENIENKVQQRTAQLEKMNKSMIGRELKMVDLKKEINELKNKK
jgi:C4-dicarboxylate-specific signal transduction histidine kinase